MEQRVYICFDENSLPETDGRNIFQQRSMFQFYKSLKNYTPFVALIEKGKKVQVSLLGVIIKEKKIFPAFLSSRCLIIGKAEFYTDSIPETEAYDLLLNTINKELKFKCLFIEFRYPEKQEKILSVFAGHHYSHQLWHNIINKLNEDKIDQAKIRQIKKGLLNGASIMEAENESQIKEFYTILSGLYKKIKKPLPSYDFFRNFYHCFCKTGNGTYLLVRFENKIIGGIMCLFENDKTIYEWYIGSLHHEHKNLYPGVLSTYAAIEYGEKNGFEFFDFMGAGQKDIQYNVRDFKKTFGGALIETYRFKRINFPLFYKLALLINKIF